MASSSGSAAAYYGPYLQKLLSKKSLQGKFEVNLTCAEMVNDEQDSTPETLRVLNTSLDTCLRTLVGDYYQIDLDAPEGAAPSPAGGSASLPCYLYLHPPVYTCEQAAKYAVPPAGDASFAGQLLRGESHGQPGGKVADMKNLFLKDKKKNHFLVSAMVDTPISLKSLDLLGKCKKGSLGFARAEQLEEKLGLIPGSVTPFGLLNDKPVMKEAQEERKEEQKGKVEVEFFLDKRVLACDYIAVHPNACNATVAMPRDHLLEFLSKNAAHTVNVIDLAGDDAAATAE